LIVQMIGSNTFIATASPARSSCDSAASASRSRNVNAFRTCSKSRLGAEISFFVLGVVPLWTIAVANEYPMHPRREVPLGILQKYPASGSALAGMETPGAADPNPKPGDREHCRHNDYAGLPVPFGRQSSCQSEL
jgi:hypothetical protein